MLSLFEAIKARYDSTDLEDEFTGISAGQAFPTINRPYVIAMPLAEVRRSRTNRGGYFDNFFSLVVVADEFEEATRLGYLLQTRLLDPVLAFNDEGGRLLLVEEGKVSWLQEDQYWKVIVEFLAKVGKPGKPRVYG